MNQTMERTFGEQSGNAKKHLDTVQNLCRDILNNHEIFSNDLKDFSNQMLVLREKVKKNPHQLRKFFVEKLTPVRDTLTFAEEQQRQQNKDIQQMMTEIKRENRETCDAIVNTFQKLKYLDKKIGQYH